MYIRLACIVIAGFLTACATPVKNVTPIPNITPVQESNKRIRAEAKEIKKSTQDTLKINKDLQGDLQSAANELDKILSR